LNPKFAVLGANSFSGAAFVRHLRSKGYEVLGLQRPQHDVNTGLERIMFCVELERPTHFVNFAALNMVGESWLHFADYYQTNVIGIARLAEKLRLWGGLEKFVQVSTPEVYGSTDYVYYEGAHFNPSTPYAVSRAAADLHLRALHKSFGFPVCFTRTVNVYGPRQQPFRIIPKTVLKVIRGEKLKLHGGGASTRSFIHIADVAEAIRLVALEGRVGEDYHSSTSRQISIRDLVRNICALMGGRFERVVEMDTDRPGKDNAYLLDDTRIRTELGWRDKIPLEDGLSETVAWFKAHAADYETLEYTHRP
jgi:dTDP-glucose 4,6-dehydratase